MSVRFSIVTPVYDAPADVLGEMIDSVRAQSCGEWELVLVDDCSPSPHVLQVLRDAASADPRIVVVERAENGGIVAASNDGLAQASGEFVGLLDHDDTLVVDALRLVDMYADRHPNMDYCYSDEDLIDTAGHYVGPFYKPDWSPERLRAQNYCTHFSVFRRSLLTDIGGFRPGFDGSQDYDIILRATERAREIVHIPFVLYHWRQLETSVASGDLSVKPYAYEAGVKAVAEHCVRVGIDADVTVGDHPGNYRVRRRTNDTDSVSAVIATSATSGTRWGITRPHIVETVRSLAAASTREIEIIVTTDRDIPSELADALRRAAGQHDVRLVEEPAVGENLLLNLGAATASGTNLLLVGDAVEFTSEDPIGELAGLVADDRVGAAGGKSHFADGRIRHGGYVHNGGPSEIMCGFGHDEPGHRGMLTVPREVSSLSAHCLMVPRSTFFEAGGLTPAAGGAAASVDFGLKLRSLGLSRVWTPYVTYVDFSAENDPSRDSADRRFLQQRWGWQLEQDPYSNPNLQPGRGDWVEAGLR